MEMFKVGDEVELDLNSPMFEDDLLMGCLKDELEFCKDMGLVPDKVYVVESVFREEDEDEEYSFICLKGVRLAWCNTRFKHAVTTLENE